MNDVDADLDARRARVFVGPAELAGILESGQPVTVLDVRWALGRSDGREAHQAAHIPGAVFVDLETELAGPASPTTGRHPLPSLESLQDAARSWGVRPDVPVVVYDAVGGQSAARAWWLLRWAGLADVRVLDGGIDAWTARGGQTESGDVVVAESQVELTPGGLPVLDADDAAELATRGVLLDARAAERFRGEVEPVDPQAGHIPGARSAPTAQTLGPDGRLLPARELVARFAEVGVDVGAADPAAGRSVGVYCGSGVTASHEVAVLASLGIDSALYPGSWSQWSNDPSRPVATGSD